MNPFDDEDLYKSIIVDSDRRSPGVVTISGHDRENDWDVKKAKGQTGASSSLNGKPIGGFTTTFQLVNDVAEGVDQFEEWEIFQRYVETLTAGPAPKAVPIYHPDLARQQYTEASVKKIYGLTYNANGEGTAKIDWIEYKPPKPKPAKKATFPDDPANPAKADPNAAKKAERDALLAEAKRPLP
jgi:hypothetical protein